MKLQILITHYNEPEKTIKPLLDSIALQRTSNVEDFNVIIVNDGRENILSKQFIDSYPFISKYYINEHKGVSAARNQALKLATAEYVMFCDADDCFFTCCALSIILYNLDINSYDVFKSTFVQEVPVPGKQNLYVRVDAKRNESTFIHGKVYRRQFLLENNIWWDEELYCHEDGYFNGLALNITTPDKIGVCNDPLYLWCYNPNSVTHKDPYFLEKTYPLLLKAQDHMITQLLKHDKIGAAKMGICSHIYSAYFAINGALKDDFITKRFIPDIVKAAKQFYLKFKKFWEETSDEYRAQILENEIRRAKQMKYYKENITPSFDEWLKTL